MSRTPEYESFNEEKVEKIAKALLNYRDVYRNCFSPAMIHKIIRVAYDLGYLPVENKFDLGQNPFLITSEDYQKIVDKIWEYFSQGLLAPGSGGIPRHRDESFFPYIHLTEKGKLFLEGSE